MPKPRNHSGYKHGRRSGYTEFRYGSDRPVTLAGSLAPKRVLSAGKRKAMAEQVAKLFEDWHVTPFENEGPIRHGLRQGFCIEGNAWTRADAEAAELIEIALIQIQAERPSWEQGQPEWTDGWDHCSWCRGPIDEEGRTRRQRFCSTECARMTIAHRDRRSEAYVGTVRRSAEMLILKEKAPAKPCAFCGALFQNARAATRFCSSECSNRSSKGNRLISEVPCLGCGEPFKPRRREYRFCSNACYLQTRWSKKREEKAAFQCQEAA